MSGETFAYQCHIVGRLALQRSAQQTIAIHCGTIERWQIQWCANGFLEYTANGISQAEMLPALCGHCLSENPLQRDGQIYGLDNIPR